jgi:hypothetical protein
VQSLLSARSEVASIDSAYERKSDLLILHMKEKPKQNEVEQQEEN